MKTCGFSLGGQLRLDQIGVDGLQMLAVLDEERHVEQGEFRRHVGHDGRNQGKLHGTETQLLHQLLLVAQLRVGIEFDFVGIAETRLQLLGKLLRAAALQAVGSRANGNDVGLGLRGQRTESKDGREQACTKALVYLVH